MKSYFEILLERAESLRIKFLEDLGNVLFELQAEEEKRIENHNDLSDIEVMGLLKMEEFTTQYLHPRTLQKTEQ